MMYKFYLFILIFYQACFGFVVLIDPGHGGEELGAIAKIKITENNKTVEKKIYEKDLALILSKKIKEKLDPYYTTYLTRSFDRTLSLSERANMAEAVKADLFISVHFNSSTVKTSQGFETYYLDNHNDVAVSKVEDVENKFINEDEKVVNQILIDLVISKTVDESKKLANLVHRQVRDQIKNYKIKDRGVKAGLFYVLALSKRPGLLIEAGFMSNDSELKVLNDLNYLDRYAQGVATGIKEFFKGKRDKDLPIF